MTNTVPGFFHQPDNIMIRAVNFFKACMSDSMHVRDYTLCPNNLSLYCSNVGHRSLVPPHSCICVEFRLRTKTACTTDTVCITRQCVVLWHAWRRQLEFESKRNVGQGRTVHVRTHRLRDKPTTYPSKVNVNSIILVATVHARASDRWLGDEAPM